MQRIQLINPNTTAGEIRALLIDVRKKQGRVSSMMRAMANSSAVLDGYLKFSEALAEGTLSTRLREQIALAVAEVNASPYCISVHTAGGKSVGLSEDDLNACRRFTSVNPKEAAALRFAFRIVMNRGEASEQEVERVRQAGFSDGEIVEIIANVGLNIFSNYFNKVAGVAADSPAVEK